MKKIGFRGKVLLLVVAFFCACLGFFLYDYIGNAKQWAVHPANQNLYQKGEMRTQSAILTKDDVLLFSSGQEGQSFASSDALALASLHLLGDGSGRFGTSLIEDYKSNLAGFGYVGGLYSLSGKGATISLTVDSEVMETAYNALEGYKGTIGVYNYKTGEVMAAVSTPAFHPEKEPKNLDSDEYEGVFLNRLENGLYVPGSIFKIITTQAALETIPNIANKVFTCEGGTTIGGSFIACTGYHGDIKLKEGFAVSCNAVYGELGELLGAKTLGEYAQKAGVLDSFLVEGHTTTKGRIPLEKANKNQLAWAAIGQHTVMVNPMQYMVYMGAIANGGKGKLPYYVDSVKSPLGIPALGKKGGETRELVGKDTAKTLGDYMRNATKTTYGDGNFQNMELCAKSGTAEVDGKRPHSWFVGFSQNPDTPFAFVIIAENADKGSSVARPIAKEVLAKVTERFS